MEKSSPTSIKDQESLKSGLPRRVRFGPYEVDFVERELRCEGKRVNLQQKPFQVLEILLEQPGELVSRASLAARLWPDLHVNYEGSLNTAMNSLRHALQDSPQGSRYVETRPGYGYRFIADIGPTRNGPSPESSRSLRQITEDVIAALASTLHSSGATPVMNDTGSKAALSCDRTAHNDCMRGRYLLERSNAEDLLRSQAYFEAALQRDSRLAAAHIGLADGCAKAAVLGLVAPQHAYARASEAIDRAKQIEGDSPDLLCARGYVHALFEWHWTEAERCCLQAIELNDRHANAHRLHADLLAAMGNLKGSARKSRLARDLDPVSPAAGLHTARVLYMMGDYDEAAASAWQVLMLEPKLAHAQYLLGLAYAQLNRIDDAMTEFENSQACGGEGPALMAAMAVVSTRGGDRNFAREKLDELDRFSVRSYVAPSLRSAVLCALGEREAAMAALEDAYRLRDAGLPWLHLDPFHAALRKEERFRTILRAVHSRDGRPPQ